MNPLIGSALIGGAVNTLGSLFGFSSSNRSSQAQREIAQMQIASQEKINQQNLEEAQRNRDFQQKTINDNYEWNSAVNQVQRYKEAGLNPYLMMSNGGQVVSASGASGSQATMNNADGAFSIMANAEANKQAGIQSFIEHNRQSVNDFLNAQAVVTQNQKTLAELYEIRTRTKDDHEVKMIDKILKNANAHELYSKVSLNLQMKSLAEQETNKLKVDIHKVIAETAGIKLDNFLKEIQNKYADERITKELAEMDGRIRNLIVDISLKYAQKQLTLEQAKKEISSTVLNYNLSFESSSRSKNLAKEGISLDLSNQMSGQQLDFFKKIKPTLAKTYEETLVNLVKSNDWYGFTTVTKAIGDISGALGMGIGLGIAASRSRVKVAGFSSSR